MSTALGVIYSFIPGGKSKQRSIDHEPEFYNDALKVKVIKKVVLVFSLGMVISGSIFVFIGGLLHNPGISLLIFGANTLIFNFFKTYHLGEYFKKFWSFGRDNKHQILANIFHAAVMLAFVGLSFVLYQHTVPWSVSLMGSGIFVEVIQGVIGLYRAALYISMGWMLMFFVGLLAQWFIARNWVASVYYAEKVILEQNKIDSDMGTYQKAKKEALLFGSLRFLVFMALAYLSYGYIIQPLAEFAGITLANIKNIYTHPAAIYGLGLLAAIVKLAACADIADRVLNFFGKWEKLAFLRVGDEYRNLSINSETGLPIDLPYNPYHLAPYMDRIFSSIEKLRYDLAYFNSPAKRGTPGQNRQEN